MPPTGLSQDEVDEIKQRAYRELPYIELER
jgi:hypothetical protein